MPTNNKNDDNSWSQSNNPCVYFFFDDSLANDNSKKHTSSSASLIKRFVSLDFLGLNEIAITNKIKGQISNDKWRKHFYLFEDVQNMKIGILDADMTHIQSIRHLKDDGSAIIRYKSRKLVYLDGYLRSLSCSRKYILFLTDFYRRLLTNIDLLVGCGIIHNNIGFKNMVVDLETFELPILTNFGFGIDVANWATKYKQLFFQYAPDRAEWPLEIHILCYIQTNKLDSLSFQNIEFVVKNVISRNSYLKTFGQKIVDEYMEEGLAYFSRYINKSIDWIVSDMVRYSASWDNYSLSICYLKIVIDIYNAIKDGKRFLIQFLRLLVLNIHSNPLKRLSVKETTNKSSKLLEDCDIDDLYLLVLQL
jgi:hypothetical protein